jgi:membrane protein
MAHTENSRVPRAHIADTPQYWSRMSAWKVIKNTFSDFNEDECTLRAAALAYYTIFALAPLLIIVLLIVSTVWGNSDAVQKSLSTQFGSMLGDSAAAQIGSMVQSADRTKDAHGTVATILAFVALLIGATGAFGQLQGALNRAWEVRTDPKQGLMRTIVKRIFSFGMVLGIAFLLLVSLVVSAALSSMGGALNHMLPDGLSDVILKVIEFVVSFGIITLLFALMFKFIPDAEIGWRDVWWGGAGTAFLFTIGKFAIGFYLGHSNPGKAFGAASALAVILVWIYYSGIIVLLGAEFTQSLTEARGHHIEASKGAVKITEFGNDQI